MKGVKAVLTGLLYLSIWSRSINLSNILSEIEGNKKKKKKNGVSVLSTDQFKARDANTR